MGFVELECIDCNTITTISRIAIRDIVVKILDIKYNFLYYCISQYTIMIML